jgi:uncharacterized protein YlxW (UPF0749 family)
MKLKLILILLVTLIAASGAESVAQGNKENTNFAQAAEDLRAQLLEVQAKESELQARAHQLDEDLKPENIERSLAGIGSTRPEELREMRRRQLTTERERVQAQLKLVATSRDRLESVIRFAETQAYQQSADGTTTPMQMLKLAAGSQGAKRILAGFSLVLGIGLGISIVILKLKAV